MTNKPYILYADDDASTQLAISKFLNSDYELQCLNNFALDCLESITKRRPDLIILGSYANLNHGSDTHEIIRSKDEFKAIPIVSFDYKIAPSEKDLYLTMPINKESLNRAIQQLLKT